MRKTVLLGFTSAVAMLAGAPHAFAQAVDDGKIATVEEIIITSQRREESAQRAAVSVDTVSPGELEAVGTNPSDLSRLVPSVQFAQFSNAYPQTSIRGVGNNTLNPYTDSTVGFNYDGVPITRSTASIGLYYDLQRVEVLKGPQGTLYGRNQTGGAVNVIPKGPVLGETGGNVTLEAGSFGLLRGSGALNIALGDKAALRGAINVIERDGFYDSGLSDDVGQSGRLMLRVEPTDSLRFQLGVDYHHQGGNGGGSTLLESTFVTTIDPPGPPPPYRQYSTSGRPLGGDPWVDVNQRCDGVDSSPTKTSGLDWDDWYTAGLANSVCRTDGGRDDTFYGVTGLAEIDFFGGTLTVIPALRKTDLNTQSVGNANIRNNEESETYTLEARYASDATKPLSWIVGGLIVDESVEGDYRIDIFIPNNRFTAQTIDTSTESWALFGTVRYAFADTFRVTAGVRYTHDEKTFDGTSTTPSGVLPVSAENTWNELTYTGGLEWDIAPDSLLYLTYGRGYKAGGFFFATPFAGYGGAAGAVPPKVTGNSYDPEYVSAITLGSKNWFLDRRLLLNAEIFQYQYEDQQVSQFGWDDWTPPYGNGPYTTQVFVTANIGKVEVRGLEIESRFLVTDNTLLSANIQRLDTEISGGPTAGGINTKGYPALNAADWSGSFGIRQTFPLGNGGEIIADLTGQYRGSIWIGSTEYSAFMEADPVTTGDFSLTYDPGKIWRLTGYVNNFTDEEVPVFYQGTGAAPTSFALGAAPASPFTASYRPPRTYGVRLSMEF